MAAEGALRHLAAALRQFFTRRIAERIGLIAWRPLHAGAVLYVAEFDRRRHAFVVGPHAACSLDSYAIEDARAALPSDELAEGVTDGADKPGHEATGVEAGSV